jgi:hypothetical protein
MVPAYQYPTTGTLWSNCAAAASHVPLVAILNPASGPGTSADPHYATASSAVRSAGGRVIGYVDIASAGIPLDSALAQVDRYRAWYELDGIFLDAMPNDSDPAHMTWCSALRDSIRAREPAWWVVGSPGANTLPGYLAGADILCIFESDGETYFHWEPDPWTRSQPAFRFVHLVHSLGSPDSMRLAVARARSRGAGWVYVTNDRLPNPWDETPVYWDALVATVETTTVSVDAPPAGRDGLRAWPNPARGTIHFEPPVGSDRQEIEIFDPTGRLVIRIPAGRSPEWDGRDRVGRPAAAGIYFARVRGTPSAPVRMALVR